MLIAVVQIDLRKKNAIRASMRNQVRRHSDPEKTSPESCSAEGDSSAAESRAAQAACIIAPPTALGDCSCTYLSWKIDDRRRTSDALSRHVLGSKMRRARTT